MRRPPACVEFVARVHGTVGAIIIVSTALVHWLTQNLPRIEFGSRTFIIAGSVAALYLLAAALVWFGAPFGPLLSRVCALLYLPRPQFGSLIWETMDSAEFRAHFDRSRGKR